ncbi:SnoaL-like domain-containing protein [Corallococcus exercitus]|uniref:SnoaL-like domain-containing protein n=1 Tax=Corallococcus exercitus TaxID=2316736 RepID=A0A7Y4KH63_9BACT|nr:nuclear transport factor 2 family protein [Corallococcus exercitus]NOK33631.1 SnoaL-like domain-containing protein [Corallococcus exercitus]
MSTGPSPSADSAPASREQLERWVLDFTDAFNRDDLDAVMGWFHPDAVYETYDGVHCRGLEAIRAAFAPQFRGDFGSIRFLTEDMVVDVPAGKVVLRWRCQHDLSGPGALKPWLYRLLYGRDFGWYGLDVLHWENGRLREKRTYAQAGLPKVRRGRA